jgi:hypothetical protein
MDLKKATHEELIRKMEEIFSILCSKKLTDEEIDQDITLFKKMLSVRKKISTDGKPSRRGKFFIWKMESKVRQENRFLEVYQLNTKVDMVYMHKFVERLSPTNKLLICCTCECGHKSNIYATYLLNQKKRPLNCGCLDGIPGSK